MQIDNVPWTNQDLIDKMDEFLKFYDERPIRKNNCGMKAPHVFYVWFLLQKYNFDNIIESGVWMGQSTWLFVEGSPHSTVFSFDIQLRYRKWKSEKVKYFGHDFMKADWDEFITDGNTLAFFDDHMDALPRLKFCYDHGFKYIIFEDNYPPGWDNDDRTMKRMIENDKHMDYINSVVKTYYEFPPIINNKEYRDGAKWDAYKTKDPLLDKCTNIFKKEHDCYTWLCFIELNLPEKKSRGAQHSAADPSKII